MKASTVLTIIGQFGLVVALAFLPPALTAIIAHQLFGQPGLLFIAMVVFAFTLSFPCAFLLAGYLGDSGDALRLL